ncbi:MAG: anti-sigma factor antagonist [Turneriella sp.]|nr:anti-sigma factor antagonist [Turneriella sp.]
MLELNTSAEKDILVLELEGALDSLSAADFRRYFRQKLAEGFRAFALDCLCLEYISSAGIAALIELHTQLSAAKAKMVLYQLSTETRQLLRFLGLEQKLPIVDDYDQAIAALAGYPRVIPEKDMVSPDELRLAELQEKTPPTSISEAPEKKETLEEQKQKNGDDSFFLEEKIGGTKTFEPKLAPAPSQSLAAPGSATTKQAIPEAQELKLREDPKKLISCPNCHAVLRVGVPGDYLCPACRFRFVYRGSALT